MNTKASSKLKNKRIFSSIIDLLISLFIFFLSFIFIIQPIFNSCTDMKKTQDEYFTNLTSTNLYTYNKKTYYCSIVELDEKNFKNGITSNDYYSFYEWRLINYYGNIDQLNVYKEMKLDSSLFIVDEEDNVILKEETNSEDVKKFYLSSIVKTRQNYFDKDETNISLYNKISRYNFLMLFLSSIISLCLIYILIPLCFEGRTLGKLMFSLDIVTIDDKKIKYSTLTFRQLCNILCVYLGILTFGASLIICLIYEIVDKKNQSLFDMLFKTKVIEFNKSNNELKESNQ